MCLHVCEYKNTLETLYKISNTIMGLVRNYPEIPTIQRPDKVSVISNNLNIQSHIQS